MDVERMLSLPLDNKHPDSRLPGSSARIIVSNIGSRGIFARPGFRQGITCPEEVLLAMKVLGPRTAAPPSGAGRSRQGRHSSTTDTHEDPVNPEQSSQRSSTKQQNTVSRGRRGREAPLRLTRWEQCAENLQGEMPRQAEQEY
jgi:hypothetical protein